MVNGTVAKFAAPAGLADSEKVNALAITGGGEVFVSTETPAAHSWRILILNRADGKWTEMAKPPEDASEGWGMVLGSNGGDLVIHTHDRFVLRHYRLPGAP